MSNDLKPVVRCGCGGEANVYSWNEEDDGVQSIHYHAICMKCGIETNAYDTEAEAITAWNTAMGAYKVDELMEHIWREKLDTREKIADLVERMLR